MDRDGLLFPKNATNKVRSQIIFDELTRKFEDYPSKEVMRNSLEIIHVSRDNETNFICNVYAWTYKFGWRIIEQRYQTVLIRL